MVTDMTFRLQHRPYRLAFRTPVRTSHGVWAEREGLLLRVEDGNGRVGYGEVAPLPWFGTETLAEAIELCGSLTGQLSDETLAQLEPRFCCVRFALAAALDPVAEKVWAHQRLAVASLLPAGRLALEKTDEALENGWMTFKWKVGVEDPADELAILDDLLGRLPNYAKLRLDANGGWNTRQAARWLERCAERPVEFIEQPVPPEQVDALLGLAQDYPVTLALDEAVAGPEDLRRWHGLGWSGIYVIKPATAGVPAALLATLAELKADAVFSSALETPIGRLAALRTAFSYKGPQTRALGFGVGALFADETCNGPGIGPLIETASLGDVEAEKLWTSLPT
jgi:O-succinylbenzoate synthase